MKKLGVNINWLYETLVTTVKGTQAHVAPFGVRILDDTRLCLDMFKGTRSLDSILETGEFAVHPVNDPAWFYRALHDQDSFEFVQAHEISVPVVAGLPAVIEARNLGVQDRGKTVRITAKSVHIQSGRPVVTPFNRAEGLVIESLILSTRKALIPHDIFKKTMHENFRVIRKVAPNSEFQATMEQLISTCLS